MVLLDEPTSGLDSDAAFSVMQSVQALAHAAHGPAIVATVHQVSTCGRRAGRSGGLTKKKPGPQLFVLFDDVLALNRGSVAFWGPRLALP